jgi:D-alanine-D-alanine ligase
MRVALAYDLKEDYLAAGFSAAAVMEFDGEDTIAGIDGALTRLGWATVRVGRGLALAERLVAGERWDLVFNFTEGVWGRSREAQVPALCELFDQPYTFADPLTCALTLDKAMAKRVIRDHGLPTAPFAVVHSPADVAAVQLEPPLFVKPVAEGSSKGVTGRSLVVDRAGLADTCAVLIESFGQDVLVERYLPGREVTVGIVGNGDDARVIAVMEVLIAAGDETAAYTAANKEEYVERVRYRLIAGEPLAEESRRIALASYHALGCRDGARVDLRCDEDGTPCFLEANPLPGLNDVRSDLPIMTRLAGHSFDELISWIVAAARSRTTP